MSSHTNQSVISPPEPKRLLCLSKVFPEGTMTCYDLHTHHPPAADNTVAIVNWYWPQPDAPAEMYSAGLHPWYLTTLENLAAAEVWLADTSVAPGCIAIGEAGLDRVVETDWILQTTAFKYCIALAISQHKPLIIHCVRAFDDVLVIKKQLGKEAETIPWIFHGFNKKPEIARKLLDAGCFLSFGAALLNNQMPAATVLRMCPADRFFLETDDRQDITIQDIYKAAADVRSVSVEEIGRQVEINFRRFFPQV